MKPCWIAGFALIAALNAHANECNVLVFLRSDARMPAGMEVKATNKARAMFHDIGIEVNFRSTNFHVQPRDRACGEPLIAQIQDRVSEKGVSPTALGYAAPYQDSGTSIHILMDRVRQGYGDTLTTSILAHVLVHEISHVLQHASRHSPDGVMKAHWAGREMRDMAVRPLPFNDEDVRLIREGIASRRSTPATAY